MVSQFTWTHRHRLARNVADVWMNWDAGTGAPTALQPQLWSPGRSQVGCFVLRVACSGVAHASAGAIASATSVAVDTNTGTCARPRAGRHGQRTRYHGRVRHGLASLEAAMVGGQPRRGRVGDGDDRVARREGARRCVVCEAGRAARGCDRGGGLRSVCVRRKRQRRRAEGVVRLERGGEGG